MGKMLEEINRDRFFTWLERVSEVVNPMISWDAIGATYIALGLFVIIVGVCSEEEEKRIKTPSFIKASYLRTVQAEEEGSLLHGR